MFFQEYVVKKMDSNHPRELVNRFGSDCYTSNSLKPQTEILPAETEALAFQIVKYIYTLTIVYIQF